VVVNFHPQASDLFTDTYRRLVLSRLEIGEPNRPYGNASHHGVRERLVCCLWFDQDVIPEALRTADGRKIYVVSPGWWNLEDGPDFRNAVVRLGKGETLRGDIETHTYASDWYAHGHQKNPAYNSVVLHVVMWNDRDDEYIRLANGTEAPQVALAGALRAEISELTERINPQDYPYDAPGVAGPCQDKLKTVDPEWIATMLDSAGDERMLQRARNFRRRTESAQAEQVFYERLLESLGYKKNRSPFVELARAAPVHELLAWAGEGAVEERARRCEAALFGVAGLLPERGFAPDAETTVYVESVHSLWETAEPFQSRVMSPRQWRFAGTRPVNFPTRRLAAAAYLVARYGPEGLLNRFLADLPAAGELRTKRDARAVLSNWTAILTEMPESYWHHHCRFGDKTMRRPHRPLGRSRATTITVDVVMPAVLVQLRERGDVDREKALHRLYADCAALPDSDILRFMRRRLFGRDEERAHLAASARRQQGLYQIFRDFCENLEEGCSPCGLMKALA